MINNINGWKEKHYHDFGLCNFFTGAEVDYWVKLSWSCRYFNEWLVEGKQVEESHFDFNVFFFFFDARVLNMLPFGINKESQGMSHSTEKHAGSFVKFW